MKVKNVGASNKRKSINEGGFASIRTKNWGDQWPPWPPRFLRPFYVCIKAKIRSGHMPYCRVQVSRPTILQQDTKDIWILAMRPILYAPPPVLDRSRPSTRRRRPFINAVANVTPCFNSGMNTTCTNICSYDLYILKNIQLTKSVSLTK